MSGKLSLVPTPIGNLGDITLRALEVLKSADVILAEDTRNSAKLLQHYEIATPMRSHHAHNEHAETESLIAQLKAGKNFALITDAGTPGISDPGFLLLRACIENDIEAEVLPGATAFVPGLILSGLPNHSFTFVGFLPIKKGRKTLLESLAQEKRTMIFYESPHKIERTLKDFCTYFGEERQASLSRELTKKFEETLRGSLKDLLQTAQEKKLKGEMVIVVAGAD
ncbi:16S rRNA (cytidine(1402)-2'-O)-methyltransferase [Ornithobacterium rhinotracheale]|uniref:16S rRNA (cytidine(1402)-2'-O)-methyltransferase n=1 Tax=Ornithobacterium rhinotracheale TaxID=28251 RepID=UPI001FF1B0D1|nr:16S rRNA (cytidine(1402)-2'-O)-methyltransferase [Ornithobacterium rhinotracheale]MCK0205113.1 16S rRNA (cytidine(1402)-2'-O)-methyltransferase [Ornithobacterium rhinotracheale]